MTAPPAAAPPLADDIHLWCCRAPLIQDSALLATYQAMLNPAEQDRHQRFYFAKDRHQYLVTRALIRCVLSLYAPAVAPAEWTFSLNAHGKPSIAGPAASLVRFNLSHSDGMIVLAVTARYDVGVDVESAVRVGRHLEAAQVSLAPAELALLAATPDADKPETFCQLWILKEAYIKACGMGMSMPLQQFGFDLRPGGGLSFSCRDGQALDWRFWLYQVDAEHRVALALRAAQTQWRVQVRDIVPGREGRAAAWHRLR